jgi:hypothetical protein
MNVGLRLLNNQVEQRAALGARGWYIGHGLAGRFGLPNLIPVSIDQRVYAFSLVCGSRRKAVSFNLVELPDKHIQKIEFADCYSLGSLRGGYA